MSFGNRRLMSVVPFATFLAIFPATWFAATASAEERKLAVLLAYPVKQAPGLTLPNADSIRDAYFDTVKNGPEASAPRVDSHAEWWEEISYGDVTVSGNVFGWALLPWRTLPTGFAGDPGGGVVGFGRAPHVDLIGGPGTYVPGEGEDSDNTLAKYRFDFDGIGGTGNGRFGNFTDTAGVNADTRVGGRRVQPRGAQAVDQFTNEVYTPGERFLDLNNNRIYDAGVFEWGIDKNGNGVIDVELKAESWFELFGVCIQLPSPEQGEPMIDNPACDGALPPLFCDTCDGDTPNPMCEIPNKDYRPEFKLGFRGWLDDAEWYDSNRDGKWNADRIHQANDSAPQRVYIPAHISELFPTGYPNNNLDSTGLRFSEQWPSFVPMPGDGASVGPPLAADCDPENHIGGDPDPFFIRIFRGDWSGTEFWVDENGDFAVGTRATQEEEYRDAVGLETQANRPAAVFELLMSLYGASATEQGGGGQGGPEYFDEQWNDNYDFPEPFEDHLRYWNAGEHQFQETPQQYIRDNYPGDPAALTTLIGEEGDPVNPDDDVVGRIGNQRYDAPDSWTNARGNTNASNKLQRINRQPADGAESAEYERRSNFFTNKPDEYPPRSLGGWVLQEVWTEFFGTPAPEWDIRIPYFRKFNPSIPVIAATGDTEERRFRFEATNGGPNNDGDKLDASDYRETDGTVLPNTADGRDGMWDSPAEYHDLPSSIYHVGGDGSMGEVTSPGNDSFFGQDLGPHDPGQGGGTLDNRIPAAGPHAFNMHGNNGWDGGNQFNLELLTWRTDGVGSTDIVFPNGEVKYARDINLDGLLDLGETIGVNGEYGIPEATTQHTYGLSPISGQPANGNPQNFYPHNRTRAMEDTVEILDEVADWEDFLGGPGAFGNDVLGLLLLPQGTGPNGMFTLPASARQLIRTRDQFNPNATGLARWPQISFFDGMGIEIGGEGEGGGLEATTFQTGFAGHEYGHIWEGWPDLYDYDVRLPPPLNIENNPVGRWCVMAGGGLVHPVAILKSDSGWINPVDITRALDPGISQQIVVRPWEFDRDKTVFTYTNPLFPTEKYWFWATGPNRPAWDATSGRTGERVNFDVVGPAAAPSHGLPNLGLMIMRSDLGSNPEALPPQQRIAAGRFTYQIIQADGEQQLENGENDGDAGDPFPGSTGKTQFTRDTDPSPTFYNGTAQSSTGTWTGLDILNIQRNNSNGVVTVTFNWSPRELPTLNWLRPPRFGQAGDPGVSINGFYRLDTRAYDQFGGTRIDFFAVPYTPPGAPTSFNGAQVGSQTKAPGDATVSQQVDVSRLADGVYTFFARLVPGTGVDGRVEAEFSPPRASIDNFGDGVLLVQDVNTDLSFFERWNVRCINEQPPGGETWEVVGALSRAQANAITNQNYTSTNGAVSFRIESRVRPFRVNDEFVFVTTGRTEHSAAVLVSDGEIVQPQPPEAAGRIISGSDTGLAPFTVSFKHDESSDPRDVPLTYEWTFGDGTDPVQSTDPNEIITHTFNQPRSQPYEVTLRAINIFGLSDTVTIQVRVNAAARPNVQLEANPRSGDAPLVVRFSSQGTTDPNPGTQSLDYVWDFGDGTPVATTPNVEHTYTRTGIFVTRLTVTNRPYGISAFNQVEIRVGGAIDNNLPPIAAIDLDRTSGAAPLTLRFNGDQSVDPENGVLEYAWEFGDGASVSGSSAVEHRYDRAGDFQVKLTVTDVARQSDSATVTITVFGGGLSDNQAPLARITSSSRQGAAPLTVRFDAAASADPEGTALTYIWNFGDGSPEVQTPTAEHTYRQPQAYTAILRVRDALGAEGAASVQVLVNAAAGNQAGQNPPGTPGGPDGAPVSPACAAGCGPMGMLPMVWMLVGMGAMRRLTKPRRVASALRGRRP